MPLSWLSLGRLSCENRFLCSPDLFHTRVHFCGVSFSKLWGTSRGSVAYCPTCTHRHGDVPLAGPPCTRGAHCSPIDPFRLERQDARLQVYELGTVSWFRSKPARLFGANGDDEADTSDERKATNFNGLSRSGSVFQLMRKKHGEHSNTLGMFLDPCGLSLRLPSSVSGLSLQFIPEASVRLLSRSSMKETFLTLPKYSKCPVYGTCAMKCQASEDRGMPTFEAPLGLWLLHLEVGVLLQAYRCVQRCAQSRGAFCRSFVRHALSCFWRLNSAGCGF